MRFSHVFPPHRDSCDNLPHRLPKLGLVNGAAVAPSAAECGPAKRTGEESSVQSHEISSLVCRSGAGRRTAGAHLLAGLARRHRILARAWTLGYLVAVGAAWGLGGWMLYHFRTQLLAATDRPIWAVVSGVVLMVADVAILSIVETELGGRRLVGQAELTRSGELAVRGLYARVRHPRYLGMMLGVLGACLLAGSRPLWLVAALWWIAALIIIRLEECELRNRFGAAYAAYAERVPALLPVRFRSRSE